MTASNLINKHYIATVGMFDGVHRGHVFMLGQLAEIARREKFEAMAITFARHPLEVLAPERAPKLITTVEQRIELLKDSGTIERVEVLDFGRSDFCHTGREFLAMLHESYGVDALAMGFNNHIGCDHASAAALAGACIPVYEISELPADGGGEVNSSAVRKAISTGGVDVAAKILGRFFSLRGIVVAGKQLGRTIGFPTANISTADMVGIIMPPCGVYAVDVTLPGGASKRGMANIGHRPTIDGGLPQQLSFEVNIFDYNANLYGKTIDVAFLTRLRDEQHFPTLDDLRRQLEADRLSAKNITSFL